MVNVPKELDTSQCNYARQALDNGVKSPMLYKNGVRKGTGRGRQVLVKGVFTPGPTPGTLSRDGRQVIPHDDAGKALLKQEAIEAIQNIAAKNGGVVVKETVAQTLKDAFHLFEATQECLGGIVDAAIEEWMESRRHQIVGNGGPGQGFVPGQGLVPGQQPGFAAGQVVHSVPPSPAAAAAAPLSPAFLGHLGQPGAAGGPGLVTHDQVNTAFGAVNVMMERFGKGQAKRDANFDAALAKRDADYDKDRKQSEQAFNAVMGRVEGLEGVVQEQGGQISDIQVHQGKTDRRLKKHGGDISALQVRHKTLGGKVRNLYGRHVAHGVQIGNLQKGALQHDAVAGEQGFRLTSLEYAVKGLEGGPQALVAGTKAASADATAEAAAKRKPPTTLTTGTAADGFSPSSSSSDSLFSDKKPSPGTARGSSTTAGGRGTSINGAGDDLDDLSDPDFFVRPIRRDGLSQADKDEMDEGMKRLETIATEYDVNGGGGFSPSSSSSTSSFSDRKPSPVPSPDNARGYSTTAGGRGTASGGGTMDDDASSGAGGGGAGTSPGGDRFCTPRVASRSRSRSRRTRSNSESYSMDEIIQKNKDLRAIVDNLLDECGDTGYSP